jgi:hypothetical protein
MDAHHGIETILLASRVAAVEPPTASEKPHKAAYDALVYAARIVMAIADVRIAEYVLPLIEELLRLHGPAEGPVRDAILIAVTRLFVVAGASENTLFALKWAVRVLQAPRKAAVALRTVPLVQPAEVRAVPQRGVS